MSTDDGTSGAQMSAKANHGSAGQGGSTPKARAGETTLKVLQASESPFKMLDELGPMQESQNKSRSPVAIRREEVVKWLNEELQAERSCWSLPFTFVFWLVFVLTAFGHRQIATANEMQTVLKRDLTQAVDPTTANTTVRRLVAAGGKTSGATRAGLNRRAGVALNSVREPEKIFDWVEATLLRIALANNVNGTSYVKDFNRIIGGARLLQRRLDHDSCPGNKVFRDYFKSVCYSLDDDLNKSSLGNASWPAFSADSDGVFSYWVDVWQTQDSAYEHLEFLRNNKWLTMSTKDLRVQIVLYNEQVALFGFAEVMFTLERTGRMKIDVTIKVLPSEVYGSAMTVIGDVIMCLLLFLAFLVECLKIYQRKKEGRIKVYLMDIYTWVNWTVVFMGCALAGFWVALVLVLDEIADTLEDIPDPPIGISYSLRSSSWGVRHDRLDKLYTDIDRMSQALMAHEFVTFWYTLVLVAKFFEAFAGNPRLRVITDTFMKSTVDLFHFMIVFLSIFFNFTLGGYFIFGQHLKEWSNVVLAFITSFRALMGDFSFQDMYNVAPISATIWFVAFMCLIFIVMLNMSLAIIMDVYGEVKEKSKHEMSLWVQVQRVLKRRAPPGLAMKQTSSLGGANSDFNNTLRSNQSRRSLTKLVEAKAKIEVLDDEKELTLQELIDLGIPPNLAEDMVEELERESADAVDEDRGTAPVHEDPKSIDRQEEARAPPLPQHRDPRQAGEIANITAGMRVLLNHVTQLEKQVAQFDHRAISAEEKAKLAEERARSAEQRAETAEGFAKAASSQAGTLHLSSLTKLQTEAVEKVGETQHREVSAGRLPGQLPDERDDSENESV